MRFFHIADVHLGAVPDAGCSWSEDRSVEIWDNFRRLIDQVQMEKPELLLISGDLFHRQPLKRELKEVNYLFSTIPDTTVVMIAGNHDPIKEDSWYQRYPWESNVIGLWGAKEQVVYIEKAHTWIYGFSYHTKEIHEAKYDIMQPQRKEGCHILLAHGGDEHHVPIRKERLQTSDFDYIALGHIHKPQCLIAHKAVYAGALEPIDRNDTGLHGFIRGSFQEGVVHTEFVPWALREYVHLTVTVKADMTQYELEAYISSLIQEKGVQHIYKLMLQGFRDPQLTFHLQRLKRLGNVIEVTDDTIPDYDMLQLKDRYEGSLIGDFIEQFYEHNSIVEEKALQYGLRALMSMKGNR